MQFYWGWVIKIANKQGRISRVPLQAGPNCLLALKGSTLFVT